MARSSRRTCCCRAATPSWSRDGAHWRRRGVSSRFRRLLRGAVDGGAATRLTADTDTNRRLRAAAALGRRGARRRAGDRAHDRNLELALTPRASISRYSGDDALDSEDWGFNTIYRRNGERLAFDAQAGVADDSTLITEPGETGSSREHRRHSMQASTSLTQYLGTATCSGISSP